MYCLLISEEKWGYILFYNTVISYILNWQKQIILKLFIYILNWKRGIY